MKAEVSKYLKTHKNAIEDISEAVQLFTEVLKNEILDTKCRKSTALKKLRAFIQEEYVHFLASMPEEHITANTLLTERRFAMFWWYLVFREVEQSQFASLCDGPELYGELLRLRGNYYIDHTDAYHRDLQIAKEFLSHIKKE